MVPQEGLVLQALLLAMELNTHGWTCLVDITRKWTPWEDTETNRKTQGCPALPTMGLGWLTVLLGMHFETTGCAPERPTGQAGGCGVAQARSNKVFRG